VAGGELGSRIGELRRARGWTVELLADFAGLTKGTVSKIESGAIASPGIGTVNALAGALAVPPDELLGAAAAAGDSGPAVGARLRSLRRGLKLTQEELAEKAGVSKDVVAKLEHGARSSARLSTLTAMADALGVTVAELLGEASCCASCGSAVRDAYKRGQADGRADALAEMAAFIGAGS